ncbi:hypothetical protein HPB51_026501 [Rhipicephalus microplus]|uniref:Uncharacterized protein n=1 Tax=Rhipicephalus microplus TaxID=6941 RepID=A0A9J6D2W9_RHIMP|nr:hypothetical protein HPB51_026501 [Rhipicephalus microplus]
MGPSKTSPHSKVLSFAGFFADLPPQKGQKYAIPLPPPDKNDGQENHVLESEASETTVHGGQRGLSMETGRNQQIRGRRHNIAGQTPRAAGKMRPPLHAAETTEAGDQHVRRVGVNDTASVESCSHTRRRPSPQPPLACAFCPRSGETHSFARTHMLREPLMNDVFCQILRDHGC